MDQSLTSPWWCPRALGLLLWVLLLLGGVLSAQEPKETTVPLVGFTRPGSPDDDRRDGKVILAADDPEVRKTALGGTIYFRVIERGPEGWGEQQKFLESFQAGIDGSGVSSPNFDQRAKYLYLYQVVNDRRTATPLQSVSVKLNVEVKDITSWGYLQGVGFATLMTRPGQAQSVVQPVAFNHVLKGGPSLDIEYKRKAPALALAEPLRLTSVPTARGEMKPAGPQKQQPITVVWDALDPATNPDHVMLLESSDFDKKPCFRAVWNAAKTLPRDGRSTIFGFTSNLPPTLEPVRLRGFRAPEKGNGIIPAAEVEAERVRLAATLKADGQVPSPKPEFTSASEAESSPPPGNFSYPPGGAPAGSPSTSSGGGGSGVPLGVGGVGGFASPRTPIIAGGGGSSGGGGTGITTPLTGSSSTSTSVSGNPQTQTINFNPTLVNTQSQQQEQLQRQLQRQLQDQTQDQSLAQAQQQSLPGTPSLFGSTVVPQPAALLLAVFGLPVLLLLRRHKHKVAS